MKSTLKRRIEKLDQMITFHHVCVDIILSYIGEDILGRDVTFAASIYSLK